MAAQRVPTSLVPPQAPEAEMAVLGAVMLDNQALLSVREVMGSDDFYAPANKVIFSTMLELDGAGTPIDLVTVQEALRSSGKLEGVGGVLYLTELLERVATAANADYYAKIVAEKARLRDLIRVTTSLTARCYEGPDDVEQFIDEAEQSIYDVGSTARPGRFRPLSELVIETWDELDAIHRGDRSRVGLLTGFKILDSMLGGLQPGNLIIVAGRPSMGKTALALDVLRYAALREKVPCALFSLEMSHFDIVQRMLSAEARVDSQSLRTGRLGSRGWDSLTRVVGSLSEAPVWVDDSAALSIMEIRAKARRLKAEHNIGVLMVDYLQLVSGGGRSESRQIEISDISRGLKALAKELAIPVVAMSQLSRKPEERHGSKRPQLSDLRESGAIEQDADVVLLLFRPGMYDKEKNEEGATELIIAKQRNGPTGIVHLFFEKTYTRFYPATSETMEPS